MKETCPGIDRGADFVSAASHFFVVVDRAITAADLDAVSQEGAAPVPARGTG